MSEQVIMNQADAVWAAATAEHPASENLDFVTAEANGYADLIARMERIEAELRAQIQEKDATIEQLRKENEQLRAQVAHQSKDEVEPENTSGEEDTQVKDAWYVSLKGYLPVPLT